MAIDALILRFSDAEESTIAKHVEVLASHAGVWWGWWRKRHEDAPTEILAAARQQLPMLVGLVNRRDAYFARAHCVAIETGPDGTDIRSPDQEATPEYYRYDAFPAWFRFERIEPISESQWDDQFARIGTPRGDPSLFWIEDGVLHSTLDQPGGAEPEPAGDLQGPEPIEMPGEHILHLSDIHYGEDHAFPIDSPTTGAHQPTMIEAILSRVSELGVTVGLVVISGDIATKGEIGTILSVAEPRLEQLMSELGLGTEHLVIVPGNHDIELDDADLRDYSHEAPFRTFLSALYGQRHREIERLTTFESPSGWTINTATLNSVRLRSVETKDYGYVGPRAAPLMRDLRNRFGEKTTAELWQERILNLTVLHHHLVSGELLSDPKAGRPVSVTLDAGRLISELQEGSTHAALHGHQHVPFVGSVARGRHIGTDGWEGYRWPLWLIGGGSAGAESKRLLNEMRDNTFGLYRPSDDGFEIQMERFNPGHDGETFLNTVLSTN